MLFFGLITIGGGGDYQLRRALAAKQIWVAVITIWGTLDSLPRLTWQREMQADVKEPPPWVPPPLSLSGGARVEGGVRPRLQLSLFILFPSIQPLFLHSATLHLVILPSFIHPLPFFYSSGPFLYLSSFPFFILFLYSSSSIIHPVPSFIHPPFLYLSPFLYLFSFPLFILLPLFILHSYIHSSFYHSSSLPFFYSFSLSLYIPLPLFILPSFIHPPFLYSSSLPLFILLSFIHPSFPYSSSLPLLILP